MSPSSVSERRQVVVDYSADGRRWSTLGEFEFARAPGTATCTADTKVPFGGVTARYVKLTIQSNWGNLTLGYGLSEVRFLAVPTSAREPDPSDGAANVAPAGGSELAARTRGRDPRGLSRHRSQCAGPWPRR